MAHRAQSILVELLTCQKTASGVNTKRRQRLWTEAVFYQEEVATQSRHAAEQTSKWVEDRRAFHFCHDGARPALGPEVAVNVDGHLLGVRGSMAHDHGTFPPIWGRPHHITRQRISGSLRTADNVARSKWHSPMTPVTPVRSANRPRERAMERLMDQIARELNIDKVKSGAETSYPLRRCHTTLRSKRVTARPRHMTWKLPSSAGCRTRAFWLQRFSRAAGQGSPKDDI